MSASSGPKPGTLITMQPDPDTNIAVAEVDKDNKQAKLEWTQDGFTMTCWVPFHELNKHFTNKPPAKN